MNIVLDDIVIRDLERKDIPSQFSIIYEKEIRRFMADWSDNNPEPDFLKPYVDWHQEQKNSTDSIIWRVTAIIITDYTDELNDKKSRFPR